MVFLPWHMHFISNKLNMYVEKKYSIQSTQLSPRSEMYRHQCIDSPGINKIRTHSVGPYVLHSICLCLFNQARTAYLKSLQTLKKGNEKSIICLVK